MRRNFFRLPSLSLLALALTLVGCEQARLPGDAMDPQFATVPSHTLRKVPATRAPVSETRTAALIGSDGGQLELAGHRLIVPAGAVSRPTRFSIALLENGYVEVDLQASQAAGAAEVNVGKRGFAQPVVLQLSYSGAAGVADPEQLVVAWVRPDGSLLPMRSHHDEGEEAVTAFLDHFSVYVLATP